MSGIRRGHRLTVGVLSAIRRDLRNLHDQPLYNLAGKYKVSYRVILKLAKSVLSKDEYRKRGGTL